MSLSSHAYSEIAELSEQCWLNDGDERLTIPVDEIDRLHEQLGLPRPMTPETIHDRLPVIASMKSARHLYEVLGRDRSEFFAVNLDGRVIEVVPLRGVRDVYVEVGDTAEDRRRRAAGYGCLTVLTAGAALPLVMASSQAAKREPSVAFFNKRDMSDSWIVPVPQSDTALLTEFLEQHIDLEVIFHGDRIVRPRLRPDLAASKDSHRPAARLPVTTHQLKADDAVWECEIDGEQVGPLAVSQLVKLRDAELLTGESLVTHTTSGVTVTVDSAIAGDFEESESPAPVYKLSTNDGDPASLTPKPSATSDEPATDSAADRDHNATDQCHDSGTYALAAGPTVDRRLSLAPVATSTASPDGHPKPDNVDRPEKRAKKKSKTGKVDPQWTTPELMLKDALSLLVQPECLSVIRSLWGVSFGLAFVAGLSITAVVGIEAMSEPIIPALEAINVAIVVAAMFPTAIVAIYTAAYAAACCSDICMQTADGIAEPGEFPELLDSDELIRGVLILSGVWVTTVPGLIIAHSSDALVSMTGVRWGGGTALLLLPLLVISFRARSVSTVVTSLRERSRMWLEFYGCSVLLLTGTAVIRGLIDVILWTLTSLLTAITSRILGDTVAAALLCFVLFPAVGSILVVVPVLGAFAWARLIGKLSSNVEQRPDARTSRQ